jgi:NADPH:quinone reductase-like Zn-dependent oxidoreductase
MNVDLVEDDLRRAMGEWFWLSDSSCAEVASDWEPKTSSETTSTTTGTQDTTMRAITQERYGNSGVLRLSDIARPMISGDRQVLVRVHAAGLDRGTEHLMTGKPYAMRLGFGVRRPKNPVPGRDVSGVVEQAGASVTRFAAGAEVYGIAPGSFAEYAVAREDKLAPKPANLTFSQAAVVPISAGTALQALTDVGNVQAGQSVLVLGASGGVGGYAVQLASAFGADVTGVCSTAKLDYVTSLGAHHVIDYTSQDWADGARRYDLILDIAGNPSVTRLRRALTGRGTVVFVGGENAGAITGMGRQLRGALLVSPFVRQRLAPLISKERAADYERLSELIAAGKVTPTLDRSFPLEQAPDAMRLLERGEIRGKIAITL